MTFSAVFHSISDQPSDMAPKIQNQHFELEGPCTMEPALEEDCDGTETKPTTQISQVPENYFKDWPFLGTVVAMGLSLFSVRPCPILSMIKG